MKQYGVFDIIGPVMVGPSSSHTAGAARLGLVARRLCGEEIVRAVFYMHGSFAQTYAGHGTDKALLAGILGIRYDDERLKCAFELAEQAGLKAEFIPTDLGKAHPNTVRMELTTRSGRSFTMTGCSIGGGSVCITELDGVEVTFSGERPILATRHTDEPGVIAGITAILYAYRVNIGNMQVNRSDEGKDAHMYMELDGELPGGLKDALERVYGVKQILLLLPGDIS
ncbi:MAG: L-serine ammonia-lyase, iron-sulfur-dependent subunit beta [Lachnospiraceae bacterium]|nr:L-serine ammonia-lyase, iron-sulfur-dependent subunit beta [Lachnospiraceae bacterium]